VKRASKLHIHWVVPNLVLKCEYGDSWVKILRQLSHMQISVLFVGPTVDGRN
jgi:hypothetical protein